MCLARDINAPWLTAIETIAACATTRVPPARMPLLRRQDVLEQQAGRSRLKISAARRRARDD
jgi:hypothetical protein